MPTGTPLESNSNDDTASSPESTYISTPTAPSPTPQAIRPKLTIPLSTPLQPWQTGSPVHHSYQSTRSAHSLRSTDSTQSDPRPPEDSTPYPHSGIPRSTYPRKGPEGEYIVRVYQSPTRLSDTSLLSTTTRQRRLAMSGNLQTVF
ncbi:hypothetical protein CDEST_15516 [Colletotrichum destructivum]|uniref:Uncharacterized protein n=1 Tax=Colletotrichum destructivum TaxID=34406 RepID=A0AAX4J4I9_9PEZI|nr:hypothetical protein CDEST_15516 [Colletotrichum destructivum]